MAKRNHRPMQKKWEPQPNDAINLATIRWFALMIEAKAIEIFGTNPSVYPEIQKVLAKCLGEVASINVEKPIAGAGDCPPGWVPCGEDCAPVCMEED
jgi:hypothetical protein